MKKILCHPHPKLKEKIEPLSVHAERSHWLHGISISKTVPPPLLVWANTSIINWGYLLFFISAIH
jgi:hypothetical protein